MKRPLMASLLISTTAAFAACGDDTDTGGTGGDAGGGGGTISACTDPAAVDDVVDVTANITSDTTWYGGCTYALDKVIYVTGANLAIEPGTRVVGTQVPAALIVTTDATIDAVGTAADPIVFTSINDEGFRESGDFGGLVLLGKARVNKGDVCVKAADGTIEVDSPELCDTDPGYYWRNHVEGIAADDPNGQFGGVDDTHDCGTVEYVRVEFAGYGFAPDNELNGLTVAGCGSDTVISYVQVHRGSDDGIEFFGGTASMDHVVISGADDDGLDWDLGWSGDVQFLVIHMFDGRGDNGFESDGHSTSQVGNPPSAPTIYNATMVGSTGNRGMLLREGTQGELGNFVVTGFGVEPLDIGDTLTATGWDAGDLAIMNTFWFGNGAFTDETGAEDDDGGFDEAAELAATTGYMDATDPLIGSTSETAPSYVPTEAALSGQATPPTGFDATATYAGAFAPNGADWTAGWTSFPVD